MKKYLFFVFLLALLGSLNAELLLEDNFAGTVGSKLTENGWVNHSGTTNYITISATNLSYPGYQSSSGGSASLLSTGEDVNREFTTQTTGDVFASFLINVSNAKTTGDYFFHLGNPTLSNTYYARVYVKKDASTNNFYFGFGKFTEAPTYETTPRSYNTTYLVVIRYSMVLGNTNDVLSMWINPEIGSSIPTANITINPSTTDYTQIGRVALRQGNASYAPTALIDGIRIGTTWIDVAGPATGNTPPTIINIVQTPSRDIMSTTTVSVNANVTDDDTVVLVQLKWGTASEEYTNVINMIIPEKGTYQTETDIPTQANGTTVYYVIYAEDNDSDFTTSPQLSYTVRDPATTTLPYTQDFSNGWGDIYTYDVSGTKPWYIYSNDNASCNGYNSSLEEHWLVLPGINFDNYTNEKMTFNTIATYGTIDENNYLKLLYSSNYLGMRNPYAAGVTWTEIPFTTGAIGGGETSSGILNLSEISGTKVYLAFKYYSTNSPTRWEVDDISIYLYDIPEGSPVTIGEDVVEITGGNANIVTGDIPQVNNDNFVASNSFILELFNTGPWQIEIQTTALWGAYYSQGAWHSVANIGGTISFEVPNAKGVQVPIVLGDQDPTLPVELSSFTAVLTSDMYVLIKWIAESETNHSGYNILRAEKKDLATAQRINAQIIDEGVESGTQISYSYTDFEAYTNMVYYYWLESVSLDGISSYYGPLTVTIGDPTQEPRPPEVSMVTKLLNAYPNPFNPNTNIRYSIKDAGKVRIDIYNMKGQVIQTLTAEHNIPGFYQIAWDGCDANGKPVASGIYMYQMTSGNYSSIKKMVLAK